MEQQSVTNLAGLLTITAIPVVAFALWCDYVERYVETVAPLELDRGIELYRVRSTAFFVQIFQIVIFFATTPVRREYPVIAYPLFMAAVLVQLAVQKSLESKIRAKGKAGTTPEVTPGQTFKTFFWSCAAGMLYVSTLVSFVFAFCAAGIIAHASMPVQIALLFVGMSFGVAAGLSLNFALASLFVQKIMNAKPLETSSELHATLQGFFSASGIAAPELFVVDVPQFHLGSALMAGFPGGEGAFRPGFFLSQELVEQLSAEELRSVVLHEISHLRLRHAKRRFTLSFGLVACSSLMTGMTVLLARAMSLDPHAQGTVGCIALIACFMLAFRTLARQVRFQELAADIHSVELLGSQLPALASALRKLDQLHGELPGKRDPGSKFLSLGHPETEHRIRVLEKYFAQKRAESAPTETSEEKAA